MEEIIMKIIGQDIRDKDPNPQENTLLEDNTAVGRDINKEKDNDN